jgi:pimeloyl-ACP methyl ester carboxylesterase
VTGVGGLPVFVLVHGAFHGGWCWAGVVEELNKAGYRAYAPSQTGLGERRHLMSPDVTMETFVDDFVNLLDSEELTDVVLVAHSFGGRTATGVADRRPNLLRRLVFLDAGIPSDGLSKLESLPEAVRVERLRAAQEHDGGVSVPPPPASRFGLTDPAQVSWVERRMTPQPIGVESSRLSLQHEVGNGVPATYVKCRDERFGGQMLGSDEYARQRTDWDYQELIGAHDLMVSEPKTVGEVLLSVVTT